MTPEQIKKALWLADTLRRVEKSVQEYNRKQQPTYVEFLEAKLKEVEEKLRALEEGNK